MKVASMTETAIIHGLEVGREMVMPGAAATVELAILGPSHEKSAVAVGYPQPALTQTKKQKMRKE